MVKRPSCRAGKVREALLEVRVWSGCPPERGRRSWESLPECRDGLGGPRGGLGVVSRASQRACRGQEVSRRDGQGGDGREGTGGPPEGREGREFLPECLDGSGDPPTGLGRPSWRVERGREAHPDGQGILKLSQNGREETSVSHGGRGGAVKPSQRLGGVMKPYRRPGRD